MFIMLHPRYHFRSTPMTATTITSSATTTKTVTRTTVTITMMMKFSVKNNHDIKNNISNACDNNGNRI